MAKFNVTVPHALDRNVVVDRLKGFSEKIRDDVPIEISDLRENWDHAGNLDFSFRAMGLGISGQVVASDQDVKITGNMPLAAMMFRSTIETQIANKVREAINF